MAEFLDIVDMTGTPTGKIIDRETAHREGILHRTTHLWILRRHNGVTEVLLQKRSADKDSFPGCYDISSAGHMPASVDWIPSALRELEEELGITGVAKEDLILCGQRHIKHDDVFHGKPYKDRQISNIYCLWLDVEPEDLILQESEVEEVIWIPLEECIKKVESCDPTFKHAIVLEEIKMLPRD
ncbi:MAG: NUDIX domain-containing protein [Firmicutes bacterium]|nr:NUDIX domain-containing protein [Bacillota bacterium]